MAGLGPTSDMSPRMTLKSWGSSSRLVLRSQENRRSDEVQAALQEEGGARYSRSAQPEQRESLEAVNSDLRVDRLEQPRNHVDLDVMLPQRRHELEQPFVRLLREGEDDAVDMTLPDDLR